MAGGAQRPKPVLAQLNKFDLMFGRFLIDVHQFSVHPAGRLISLGGPLAGTLTL